MWKPLSFTYWKTRKNYKRALSPTKGKNRKSIKVKYVVNWKILFPKGTWEICKRALLQVLWDFTIKGTPKNKVSLQVDEQTTWCRERKKEFFFLGNST